MLLFVCCFLRGWVGKRGGGGGGGWGDISKESNLQSCVCADWRGVDSTSHKLTSGYHPVVFRLDCVEYDRCSFSFSWRWHCSARKGPYALRPVSQQSPQGCLRNSANICLVVHDRSRPWRVECRPLPFSTPLSFRRSMLWCSGLSMLRKFLKPLSTSTLPSCRPDVISPVLASISARSFPLTPAWPMRSQHVFAHITEMLSLSFGCLSSQQLASMRQGRICACCHTEIEVAYQTF